MNTLTVIANIAAIATALIAFFGYGVYRLDQRSKRRKLEEYLKRQLAKDKPRGCEGKRSLIHIMARVGLTEAEVLHASFSSKHIVRYLAQEDATGRATAIMFGYADPERE